MANVKAMSDLADVQGVIILKLIVRVAQLFEGLEGLEVTSECRDALQLYSSPTLK